MSGEPPWSPRTSGLHAADCSLESSEALVRQHSNQTGLQAHVGLYVGSSEDMGEAKRTLQIFVRMPEDLVIALDRYLERLRAEQPGTNLSRSDVIRLLLYRALRALEGVDSGRRQDLRP